MFRALTILAAIAVLAVTASPASAVTNRDSAGHTLKTSSLPRGLGAANVSQLSLRKARLDGHSMLVETDGEKLFLRGKAKVPRRGVVVLIGANNYGLVAGRPDASS